MRKKPSGGLNVGTYVSVCALFSKMSYVFYLRIDGLYTIRDILTSECNGFCRRLPVKKKNIFFIKFISWINVDERNKDTQSFYSSEINNKVYFNKYKFT